MSKKFTPWFPHETNPRSNRKLKALFNTYGGAGYGYWWILQEILCSQPGYKLDITDEFAYAELADDMRCDYAYLEKFIGDCVNKFHLLQNDDTHLWCPVLIETLQPLEEKRARLSEYGKIGAEKKKKKKLTASENVRVAEGGLTDFEAEKKREENKTEEKSRVEDNTITTSSSPSVVNIKVGKQQPLPFATLDELKERALADTVHFVPIHLRAGCIADAAQLPLWLDAFNKWLRYGGEHVKNERDYRLHFNNWLKMQDLTQNPAHYNPLTDNKTATTHRQRGRPMLPSPPPLTPIEEALRLQREETERALKRLRE